MINNLYINTPDGINSLTMGSNVNRFQKLRKNDILIFPTDVTILNSSIETQKQKLFRLLNNDIKSNNATYESGAWHSFKQCLPPSAKVSGAEIKLKSLPSGIKTLGDVKQYYGLPDGCLKNNIIQGGGNLDSYEALVPIKISVEPLAKGLRVSIEEIENLFNK